MGLGVEIKLQVVKTNDKICQYFESIRNHHEWDITIFGVDLEWNKRGTPKLDLITLSTSTNYCIIIQLYKLRSFPTLIKSFLQAPDITKVGLRIKEQADYLRKTYGFNMENVVDVRHLVDEEGYDPRREEALPWILGEEYVKYKNIRNNPRKMSNLERTARAIKVTTFARLFTSLTMRRARETYGLPDWKLNKEERIPTFATEFWQKYLDQPFDFAKSRFARKLLVNLMIQLGDTSIHPPYERVTRSHPSYKRVTRSHPSYKRVTRGYPPYEGYTSSYPPYERVTRSYHPYEAYTSSYPPYEGDTSSYPPYEGDTNSYPPYEGDTSRYSAYEGDTSSYPPYEGDTRRYPLYEGDTSSYPPYEGDNSRYLPYEGHTFSYPPYEGNTSSYPPYEGDYQ